MEAVTLASRIATSRPTTAITPKGDRDFASDVDFAVEDAVRAFLRQETPEIPLLGEERGLDGPNTEWMWTLDPIDGTVNYVRQVPLCAVSLALLRKGKPVVGVIDLPLLNQRFHAAVGEGAFANNVRLHASKTSMLADALVSIGDYAVGDDAEQRNVPRVELTKALLAHVQRIRMLGSAAIDLAWVASGQLDASVMLSNNPWDVMAGSIIAQEAGAEVLGLDGESHSVTSTATIAVSPSLVGPMMELVQAAASA